MKTLTLGEQLKAAHLSCAICAGSYLATLAKYYSLGRYQKLAKGRHELNKSFNELYTAIEAIRDLQKQKTKPGI